MNLRDGIIYDVNIHGMSIVSVTFPVKNQDMYHALEQEPG
jgi:hypothetical protein